MCMTKYVMRHDFGEVHNLDKNYHFVCFCPFDKSRKIRGYM